MPARRLILIEGMIGAGKSTTAEPLASRLATDGNDVRAFLELAADHPIRTRSVGEQAVVELHRAWEGVVDELLATVESVLFVDPQRDWEGTLQALHDAVRAGRPTAGEIA